MTTPTVSWTRPAFTSAGLQLPEGAYYDEAAAQKAIDFFGLLKLVEGESAGKPWPLMKWMEYEVLRPLFGYKRADGSRLYRTAWVEVPRKNAKTTLAAAIALYGLTADGEPGAQCYIGARDRAQAKLCFDLARKMVEASPALKSRCRAVRSYIEVPKTGGVLRALSGDAPGLHGLNAHVAILDEVHAHKSREVWDVLSSSVGARRQPLVMGITTAGVFDPTHISWEMHDYAIRVASGDLHDPSFLTVIYAADADADWTDENVWAKANPSLDVSVSRDFLRDEVRKAKASPARQTTFAQLYLNRWTREVSRWLDMNEWDACGADPVDPAAFTGRACYVGLDLSSTTDVTAAVALFPSEDGESFDVLPHFWLPEANIAERERRDHLPYSQWAASGHLTLTPGNVVDYRHIRDWLINFADAHPVLEMAYDPWNATGLVTELAELGMRVAPTRQGFATMSAPTKELERLVLQRGIRHGGHPVLRAHADAALVKSDPAGNYKPDKATSVSRIDGVVATIMALNSAMLAGSGSARSVYEERGMTFL